MTDRWLLALAAPAFVRDEDDAYRIERVLATPRLVVAGAFAVFLHMGPLAHGAATTLVDVCGAGYLLYSAAVLLALRQTRAIPRAVTLLLHLGDVVWAGVCTIVDGGPSSAFFALHIFAVLAAAYRWGLRETLVTAAASAMLLVLEPRLLPLVPAGVAAAPFSEGPEATFRRVALLFITAYLGGYLADQDRRLRQRTALHARIVANAKSEHGFFASLQAVAREVLGAFGAREFLLAVDDRDSGRMFLLSTSADQMAAAAGVKVAELPLERRDGYFFPAPATWSAVRQRRRLGGGSEEWTTLALDADGRKVDANVAMSEAFLSGHPSQGTVSAVFPLGDGSSARLFLLDVPRRAARDEELLGFVQQLVGELGPIIHGIYLYRHLRRRAGAIERARMARELHDGVIQSLIGVEMRLEALRMRMGGPANEVVEAELTQLQRSVREEVLNLRDLMQQMKPRDVSPRQLLEYLIDIVDRFGRDTGIRASFSSDLDEVPLPQQARRELARILQEALINVRKHSGARNVLVAFERHNGSYHLVVDDDGRGYDFEGRLGQAQLDAARRGPVVIKERVRAIGGEITIDSVAGRGSRLEIVVPHRAAPPAG